ncbi:MAG TPA: polymer-forming cytoskeletal protein [Spirochaetota bacterium]|nr:polymer-forming cytoskeletal protein [Spirochaetota bacterium]
MPYEDFNKIDEEYFDTILEDDFSFEGTIKQVDSVIIKGYVKGRIESEKILIVGPDSVIDADVKAKNIQCFGKINGNLVVEEEAYFHNPSSLKGDISTPVITIEKGCTINGKVSMPEKTKKDNGDEK